MPSINVLPQPTAGYNIITVNWTDQNVPYAAVTRTLPDGTVSFVRPHTATDPSGNYLLLSGPGGDPAAGGVGVFYDTEAPFNTVLIYTTIGLEDTGGGVLIDSPVSATAPSVTLTNAFPWLKSPIHPWANKQLVYVPASYDDLSCLAGDSIVFAQMADEVRANRSSTNLPNDAKNPVGVIRTRGGIGSTLRLITRTFVARDAVITLNESGDVLLFQIPDAYGIPDRYMLIGDYGVTRFSADHKKQWRANVLPHIEVDAPPGLADGVLGVRWIDLCDTYPTFDDAEAAGLTWTMVLLGQAGAPPTVFCDYDDLAAAYATYNAMTAANVDYDALLDC
jgi:hypothetical protein